MITKNWEKFNTEGSNAKEHVLFYTMNYKIFTNNKNYKWNTPHLHEHVEGFHPSREHRRF